MTGLLIKFGLAILLVGSLFFYGKHVGWQQRDLQAVKDASAAAEKFHAAETAYYEITVAALTANDSRQAEIQWRTKVLIQKVPEYVTPAADSRCVIPVGFVRLYDAQVAGSDLPATAPGESFDADSGVTLSRVAETDQYNLGVAKSLRSEVTAWREWYSALATASPRP